MQEYISFFLFSHLYFQLSVYIGAVGTVAIKIDQVHAESKLTMFFFLERFLKGKIITKGID